MFILHQNCAVSSSQIQVTSLKSKEKKYGSHFFYSVTSFVQEMPLRIEVIVICDIGPLKL